MRIPDLPLLKALAAQFAGLLLALLLTWLLPAWRQPAVFLLLQATAAALTSRWLDQAPWWPVMHLLFLPAAFLLMQLQWPSWIYLVALLVMALVFWGTLRGDVPLFLSSPAVARALETLVRKEGAQRVIDLGAGVGSVVVPLAMRHPNLGIEAWEHSPLPWLLARWRCRHLPNVRVIRGSFWECDLSVFDLVFAFLSPLPMAQLGEKVLREMPPGSLFVSSSFAVPDWEAEMVLEIEDRRGTSLYCYRIPES